ncbi:phosphotransferase enzyme family protein [Myxacorys almedinensis]|uniref:Phosphotransferase n=1 Tax=Myxacorys almedinensis A TaxID=2690445 RepID=A0A8J7Z7I2_9CYAN|nr:aminoglycoside phosphotransferase family protein [Myxacorys almedinensis]NDJ19346.1 phosphotransferase [Myxacorys almedinensis A]
MSDPPTHYPSLIAVAERFASGGAIAAVEAFGSGNINDTFLATVEGTSHLPFVLQRINTRVFRRPQLVMKNMSIFTRHVRDRLQHSPLSRRWEVPRVLLTTEERDHWVEADGSVWRAISFIDGSESFDAMHDVDHATEVGYALGTFHNLISDLSPAQLADTLEGFHITPLYLQHYDRVVAKTAVNLSPEVRYGLEFVRDRASWCAVLETAKTQGKLPLRLMHGDPKVNNVMFDRATGKAVSMIDLDTVKPGLVHYDIGDCLRSGCNPIGEETEQWETVYFEPDLCEGILRGYLSVAQDFLTDSDYDYLFDAIRLIAFELGLRFFTDYLAGNVYFKVKHPDHNLLRALVQFQLTQSIEFQETAIRALIQDLR